MDPWSCFNILSFLAFATILLHQAFMYYTYMDTPHHSYGEGVKYLSNCPTPPIHHEHDNMTVTTTTNDWPTMVTETNPPPTPFPHHYQTYNVVLARVTCLPEALWAMMDLNYIDIMTEAKTVQGKMLNMDWATHSSHPMSQAHSKAALHVAAHANWTLKDMQAISLNFGECSTSV